MGLKYPAWIATEEKTGKVMVKMYDILGGIAGGDSVKEAKENLIGALKDEVLEDGTLYNGILRFNYFEQNRPVPLPSPIEDVPTYLDFLEMDVPVDMIEFPDDMSKQIMEHNERCARLRA